MCDVQWIKLSTDIFSNRKIKQLQYIPNGDTIFFVWIRLLVLAAETNDGGQIYLIKGKPYSKNQLAAVVERSTEVVAEAINVFQDFDMITLDNGIISIKNWEKYQNVDGMEIIREQTRNRVRKHREKMNDIKRNATVTQDVTLHETLRSVTSNVTVTQCNATDKELDKERDIEYTKEKVKKEKDETGTALKRRSVREILKDKHFSEPLEKTILDFMDMRDKKRKPMTEKALELMLSNLDKLASDERTKIAILNQSIMNAWDSVYALDRRGPSKQSYVPKMTKEDEENLDFVLGRASS